MQESAEQFSACFKKISLSPPQIPMVSNLTGTWLEAEQVMDPNYWCQHLRGAVKFRDGIDTLLVCNYKTFIEVGPGYSLSSFAKEIAQQKKVTIVTTHTLSNYKLMVNDEQQFLTAIGQLWQNGFEINWLEFYKNKTPKHIAMPTYAFQRQRYWVEPDANVNQKFLSSQSLDDWCFKPTWTLTRDLQVIKDILPQAKQYYWIIFKNQDNLGHEVLSLLQNSQLDFIVIESGLEYKKLNSRHYVINISNKSHFKEVFSSIETFGDSLPVILNLLPYSTKYSQILSDNEINQALDNSFYSSLYIAQAYIDIFGDQALKYLLVTNGSQKVLRSDGIFKPVNATLAGVCRVLPQEHPQIKAQLIDISPSNSMEILPPALINLCVENNWNEFYPIQAIRDNYQWQMAYEQVKLLQPVSRLKDNGVYLFTGGVGGISLTICETIAKNVNKPTFILISRTKIPANSEWNLILNSEPNHKFYSRIKTLQNIVSLGAIIHLETADVGDYDSINSAITKSINECGKLDGVVHTAGIAGGGLLQLKTKEIASKVLSPKVHGTYNLARILSKINLDFVVLCSSISALIGEPSQVDYCGANSCLDSFANSGIFNNFTVSINWNSWKDVGMAVETDRPDDIIILDRDNDITPFQGGEIFLKAIQHNYPQIAVSKYEITEFSKMLARQDSIVQSVETKISRDDLSVSNYYVLPRNQVEEQLVQLWQDTLCIQQIGIEDDFFNLGGHS